MNENKLAFIICSNDDLMLEEALNYLNFLEIPDGMEVEVFTISDAESMLSGMQEGREATDAKYKVFLHQDTFILYPHFIESIVSIFESDSQIGMIGMVGTQKMPMDAVMWNGDRIGAMYTWESKGVDYKSYRYCLADGLNDVVAVDGFCFATAYDIPLRMDLFDGWDFYDVSTSFEYIRNGYRVVVPTQNEPWCLHDDGMILSLWNYDKYRHIAMKEYVEFFGEISNEETFKILLWTENSLRYLKLCVENIRLMSQEYVIELYVADNGSSDGTKEWLSQQEDLSYVYFDEGRVGFAKLLNESIAAFGLEQDVLIFNVRFFPQQGMLDKLYHFIMSSQLKKGIVGFHSNGFYGDQYVDLKQYEDKTEAEIFRYRDRGLYFQELGVHAGAFNLQGDIYQKIGRFDESLIGCEECMEDYFLRCIQNDVPIVVPTETIAFFDVMDGASLDYRDDDNSRQLLRDKWGMNYFNLLANMRLINEVAEDSDKAIHVLEIGCDNAATLLAIKNRLPKAEVYGAEINKKAAEIASHFVKVECADINVNFPFQNIRFDYIIFGDVLEHLPDPLKTLKICKNYLNDGGCILASIPNLMHISVIRELLKGNFTYTDMGLLDKTHIHLFTYNEIVKMFKEAGFGQINIKDVVFPIADNDSRLIDSLLQLEPVAKSFMYDSFQFIVKARM